VELRRRSNCAILRCFDKQGCIASPLDLEVEIQECFPCVVDEKCSRFLNEMKFPKFKEQAEERRYHGPSIKVVILL
jgi:hypothetical protein